MAEATETAPETTTDQGAAGAAPVEQEAPATLAGGDQPAAPERWYSEDWRARIAGEDPEMQRFLQSHENPEALAKAARSLRRELSKRPKFERPGDDATDEQWAAWRKEKGIPAAANEYRSQFQLPDNYDAERDAAVLDEFGAAFHELDMPAAQANKLVDVYFDRQAQQEQEFAATVAENQQKTRYELTEEWGGPKEFDTNIMALKRFATERIGEEAWGDLSQSIIVNAQGQPVGKLGDHPAFLRLTVGAARDNYGDDLPMLDGSLSGADLDTRRTELLDRYNSSLDDGSVRWTEQDDAELQKLSAEKVKRERRAAFGSR